jgi:hypothetical protein
METVHLARWRFSILADASGLIDPGIEGRRQEHMVLSFALGVRLTGKRKSDQAHFAGE